MTYPAYSLSELDKYPNTIACRTQMTQDGPESFQVLHRIRNLGVNGA